MTRNDWWAEPACIEWIGFLLTSFRHWTGRDLLARTGPVVQQARAVFQAPFVIVSHGNQGDPILNYGNRAALDLWEMTWEEFSRTPSRLTAEPANQTERARMLADAHGQGYLADYHGVRISKTGRRFLVEHAIVWNVLNADKNSVGQAATFPEWKWLD
jgi:hypothetical protein